MPRSTAKPLLSAALALVLGACGHPRGPEPAAAPAPVHPAASEQLGDEPRIDAAPPVAVAPGILGSAHYDLPVVANQWVQGELDFLVNQRHEVIGTWLRRADYYQDWVKGVFAGYGVPLDLSHLAMVESGYLPTARSRAGAVGMWQFMAGTGKGLGLRVDDVVDERMDPVRSTHAAARHLRDLNQAYAGDWALAVAAYNAGTGRISRGLRSYNVSNFWDLAQAGNLAEETKRYVPRLYAVTIVAHDPARFGYPAAAGPVRRFAYDSVRVDVMTPLAQLAETGGVPLGDLLELNPHLVRQTAPADYWVWTPRGTGAAVQTAFNASDFRRSGGYGYYLVRQGDDFTKLATAAGLSVDQVRAMNPHVEPAGLSRGQRLVFPVGVATLLAGRPGERVVLADGSDRSARRSSSARSSNSANGNADAGDDSASASGEDAGRTSRGSASERAARNASSDRSPADEPGDRAKSSRRSEDPGDSERPARRSADAAPRTFVHTVVRGETLAGLAERFEVSPSTLRRLNEMEGSRVRPGQKLRVPRPAEEQTASADRASTRSARASSGEGDAKPRTFVHTVRRGETLASLAERFEVSERTLRRLNEMESSRVRPGQELRIPRPADEQSASSDRPRPSRSSDDAPARSTRAASDLAADHPGRSARSSDVESAAPRVVVHTVREGETLASLADRFEVSASVIRRLNDMETSRLRPGQKLRIPRPAEQQTAAADRSRSTRSADGDGERSGTRSTPSSRASDGESSAPRTFVHTVVEGETLAGLAERFDVPPARIRTLNEMETSRVRPGQKLRIPRPADEQSASADRPSSRAPGAASSTASRERSSDSGRPAARDRAAPSERASAERGASSERSSAERSSSDRASSDRPSSARRSASGDSERAGSSARTGSPARNAERTASTERTGTSSRARGEDGGEKPARGTASTRSTAGDRTASADRPKSRDGASGDTPRRPAHFTQHTVQRGETLYGIARQYDVSVNQIRNANDMSSGETLSPGRRLRIPASSER
ncbi:MAG: Lytic transglycosylase catalytic [Gemmatimonadetes bacterium]|nr:Lytic transglycosylase catalytic [Gemmatimonadota bacterium]